MHDLIRLATRELAAFLSKHLPALGAQWWTMHVEEQLSYTQQQRVRDQGLTRLDQLDFAALLRIVDRNWFELSQTANLPREGRDWVRELQSVRNRWAHASAEEEVAEDVFRDADTLGRCLGMMSAGPESTAAVEAVKTTALRKMAAARSAPEWPSEPTPARTTAAREGTQPRATDSVATVEVRDHSLWTSHIRGENALKAMLNRLRGQSRIELEVDGFHGTWQKMDDGRDGRPTTGLKPVGPAQTHWHALLRDKLGSIVTIALSPAANDNAMGRQHQRFEAIWAQIQRSIAPSDTIRNWSRHSGYLGNDFTIHAVTDRFVEVDSPGAANIQHIARAEFARVHEQWEAYNARMIARSKLRDITRFSTYVISILNHVLDPSASPPQSRGKLSSSPRGGSILDDDHPRKGVNIPR